MACYFFDFQKKKKRVGVGCGDWWQRGSGVEEVHRGGNRIVLMDKKKKRRHDRPIAFELENGVMIYNQ